MSDPRFGFRFSVSDGVVVALCTLATWLCWAPLGSFAWLLPVALGHFFLFCNVFRIRRKYELWWAVAFLVNFGSFFVTQNFSWVGVLAVQTPFTVLAIVAEMRSPQYHGIVAQRVNPKLDAYLDDRFGPLRSSRVELP